jgi:hypothetical protein
MAISAILIFSYINKYIKDKLISFLATLITIFTFELGSYSFNFILPQTFTLILFLNMLLEKNLNWKKVLLITPILLATHFILGPFFIVISIAYIVLFNSKSKTKTYDLAKTITLLLLLGIIITFVANLRGFSLERTLQTQDVEQLGGFLTNHYFPNNLVFLVVQYGPIIMPLIIAIIYFLFKKKEKENIFLFAIFYIATSLCIYFLGPTYANKFLIGSTVFVVLLIGLLLLDLRTNKFLATIILSLLLFSSLIFYLLNLQRYNLYYTQNTGKISAVVDEDYGIVKHLKNNRYDCQIISDSYTQLIVASNTHYETAGGHYQELETRRALVELIDSPGQRNYERLLTSPDIKTDNLCILLSSRIYSKENYTTSYNVPWLNSMYEHEINNNFRIPDTSRLGLFLLSKDYEIVYLDKNFKLLVVQD